MLNFIKKSLTMKLSNILISSLFVASTLFSSEDTIPIRGFFDVGSGYIDKEKQVDFTTGNLDLYLTKSINDDIYALIELVFETDGSSFVTDLERLQIAYDINEYLTTIVGKFHTPYGYWQGAFHHGAQIQTSILRPRFIAFEDEGGILPSHSVGIWADGDIGDISYDFYISNGSSIEQSDDANGSLSGGNLETNNGDKQYDGKLYGSNLAYNFEELKIGLHSLYQHVYIFGNRESQLLMYGAYLSYDSDNVEVIAESYFFDNKNISDTTRGEILQSYAYFAQVGYHYDNFVPYIRCEKAKYNEEDYYFISQGDVTGHSYERIALGNRFDVSEDASIKLALIETKEETEHRRYDILAQFAIRF